MKNTAIIKYTVTIEEVVQGDTAFFRAVATDPSGHLADIKIRHYLIDGVDYGRDIQLAAVMDWAKMMEQGRRLIKTTVYETIPL